MGARLNQLINEDYIAAKSFSLCIVLIGLLLVFMASSQMSLAATIEDDYVNPPGFFPIIYISGSEFEMGYQYGYQASKYISLVKDGLWSTLLERYDKETILNKLSEYESYVANELPGVNYLEILRGIAIGAQDAGYNVTYWDVLLINYQVEFEWLPLPESCTNMAAWGNATADGKLVVGSNFDYPRGRGYAYIVMIIAYPENGNAFISFGIAGRLGNNFQMNDKGLVHESNKGPNARPEDIGYGVTDFIIGPYIAMTCSTAEEARDVLLRFTPTNGINHLVVDVNGHAYAVETTHALKGVRKPGAFGEKDYMISVNHYLNTTMMPAQQPWDPAKYYTSSWYRYITVERYIEENYGQLTADTVMMIMSSTDFWNGSAWIEDAGWTGNTVNRFGFWGATFESKVAVPEDRVLWVCAGNPGYPQWGRLAPGSYGQYVKVEFKDSPLSTTKALMATAEFELFATAQAIEKLTANNDWSKVLVNELFDQAKSKYWKATHKLALAELTGDTNEALKLYGEASTGFAEVTALCKYIRSLSTVLPPGQQGPQGPPGEPAPMEPVVASLGIAIIALCVSGIAVIKTRRR
ncbi:MAG: C45 family autoproteolytic acyltransferase/hydrolase [Candidatus Nezhaarchaeales archaeon]